MRVLHVLNSLRGGATMSALSLLRTARRRSSPIEHYVVYPGRRGERSATLEGLATDSCAIPLVPWNLAHTPWTLRGQIGRWRGRLRTARQGGAEHALAEVVERWRVDVVHTNSVVINAGARFASRAGVPHVWHLRERIGSDGFMWFRAADAEVARFIAGSSAVVPVISEYVREVLVRHEVGAKTRLVFDGVDADVFSDRAATPRATALRACWGAAADTLVVGMVGGLGVSVKRHDVFLAAAAAIAREVPTARFVIVGAVPPTGGPMRRPTDAYVRSIQASIREHGLRDRVVFAGFTADMPAVWQALDVYVHACEVEGFSRAILEAMAAGTPVVAVAAGGNPEAIQDGTTGLLFAPGDATGCAEAVLRLHGDREQCRVLAASAGEEVRRRFGPDGHYDVMAGVFEEALGAAAASATVMREGS